MKDIGFDIISDLALAPEDDFDWENKVTSLYCLVAGNVSYDLPTTLRVLEHLSELYHGVFYVPGPLEYQYAESIQERTEELANNINVISNTRMLYQHVIIIDGIAIIGVNGWNNAGNTPTIANLMEVASRYDDITYLHKSIAKLQKHLDVKKIIVVTSGIPSEELYFGEKPDVVDDQIPLCSALGSDTEMKVSHWVFGTYGKTACTYINNINFVNNPYIKDSPYWAKRITIRI